MATLFTKIINGEIPCHKIAENEHFFSFLDINPNSEGHTLVIPKKEVDYFYDLPDDTIAGLMAFSKKIARAIDKSLDPIRTGVLIQGLEVPHAHVHLIPLYTPQQPMELSHSITVSDERMKEIAEALKKAIRL